MVKETSGGIVFMGIYSSGFYAILELIFLIIRKRIFRVILLFFGYTLCVFFHCFEYSNISLKNIKYAYNLELLGGQMCEDSEQMKHILVMKLGDHWLHNTMHHSEGWREVPTITDIGPDGLSSIMRRRTMGGIGDPVLPS